MKFEPPTISVITVSCNAANYLPGLIDSLRNQTDRAFEFIIIDALSSDGTVDQIRASLDIVNVWLSEPDFGIYDALNKAIKLASGDYYLVLGADDKLFPNAIETYKAALLDDVDIVTALIELGGVVIGASRGPAWLVGMAQYVSGHAVGSLIKRDLHNKVGFYSNKYPICADQLFIQIAAIMGAKIKSIPSLVGSYGVDGKSAQDRLGMITEFCRVQIDVGRYRIPQVLLCSLRLMKSIIN